MQAAQCAHSGARESCGPRAGNSTTAGARHNAHDRYGANQATAEGSSAGHRVSTTPQNAPPPPPENAADDDAFLQGHVRQAHVRQRHVRDGRVPRGQAGLRYRVVPVRDPLTTLDPSPDPGGLTDSTIVAMTDHGMAPTDAPSPKMIAALLREARSVSRRADKLGADVTAVQDPTIQQLAAEASSSIQQLVHHLMLLDQQAQRTRRGAGHRAP